MDKMFWTTSHFSPFWTTKDNTYGQHLKEVRIIEEILNISFIEYACKRVKCA